jgi:hypothetical protein
MPLATGQVTLTDLNDVRQYILYLNGNYKTQVYDPNAKTYNPNFTSANVKIVPELYVSGGDGSNLLPSAQLKSINWFEGTDTEGTPLAASTAGTTPAGLAYTLPVGDAKTTDKTLTIKSNLVSFNTQVYTCEIVYVDPDSNFEIPLIATYELAKITNGATGSAGQHSMTAILTNEAVAIPTDSAGNNGNYANSGTDIWVYEGTDALSYDGTGTANGTFKVTAAATGVTAGALSDPGDQARVANASAISADQASITYTITGKRNNGTAFTLTKVQNFSRVKGGVAGTTPTTYWLMSSPAAITKTKAGAYTPNVVSASGMSQTGTSAPAAYSTWYRFSESTDGTTFTTKQTSTANATSATYTVSAANLKAIKVEMFTAGGTSRLIDSQIIPIVTDGTDGSDGVDAYYLNVWAPDGDAIRNSSGTIKLEADMYKGAAEVTPTAFKWYNQDPSATTTSGGDADGGNGWRLMTTATAFYTAMIVIGASMIDGVEAFKCVATAPGTGRKYSGVIVVRDFQDPIVVNIIGANIFKNGQGSVTLTAQLIQSGNVIPNTGYKFDWALYSTAGALIKRYTGTTGDTITIPASDVTNTGNLIVDVSK